MTTIELFNQLPEKDQELLIIYFVAGVSFILFTYVTYYCKFVMNIVRYMASLLWFSVGFMFLSTGGKMMQGQEYDLIILTQGAVVFCTVVAFWSVVEILKWNRKNQKEKLKE